MLGKIQEKIDKYEVIERRTSNPAKFNLIGEFLGELRRLLENAKEKKKSCCEKETPQVSDVKERWIRVTKCRNCPWVSDKFSPANVYCRLYPYLNIEGLDIIHPLCPLDKDPTRTKDGV